MAIEDDDPLRRTHRRMTARAEDLARRMFRISASPEPVKRADGTVYDGTGQKPTARDLVEQVNAQERSD